MAESKCLYFTGKPFTQVFIASCVQAGTRAQPSWLQPVTLEMLEPDRALGPWVSLKGGSRHWFYSFLGNRQFTHWTLDTTSPHSSSSSTHTLGLPSPCPWWHMSIKFASPGPWTSTHFLRWMPLNIRSHASLSALYRRLDLIIFNKCSGKKEFTIQTWTVHCDKTVGTWTWIKTVFPCFTYSSKHWSGN